MKKIIVIIVVIVTIVTIAAIAYFLSNPSKSETSDFKVLEYPDGGFCTQDVPPSTCESSTVILTNSNNEQKVFIIKGFSENSKDREKYQEINSAVISAFEKNKEVQITFDGKVITSAKLTD